MLPQIRGWLSRLVALRQTLSEQECHLKALMAEGRDVGGPEVHRPLETVAAMSEILGEFNSRQIQIKDLDRGLIDFPAMVDGEEVFLCWETEEDAIEYYHDLESGYAGRQKLGPTEEDCCR